ncbi:MAG: porin [Alistipes sp.]|nr:porin [Alistipes sp.]
MTKTTRSLGAIIRGSMLLCAALFTFSLAQAQQDGYEEDNEIFRLGVEARFDYIREAVDGTKLGGNSGFKVRYFNLRMDGQITPKFTYSWRQRFNRANSLSDFAQNTDWLHLTYRPTKNWAISAGKQVVMIGGWEYDRAPIELYFCSEFWNNVSCYALGTSVAYTTNEGNDTLTFQFCQSPYDTSSLDLFAYNLYWMGQHGFYTALHSINFSEYAPGKFDAYVVLGNQFQFGDAKLQLDLMNRGITARELLFENFSIMGEFSYLIADRVNIFAKATYDKIGNSYVTGLFLFPGTEVTRLGGGVEYYPLGHKGNRDVRLHAAYAHTLGNNTNPAGTAIDKQSFLTVGLTWKIDILSAAEKFIGKVSKK